ncbi:sensor domain-containing diguanylate cyclase [Pseudomonas sp. 10B1]|uniref:sensor domain-containing diguanylate cyclase n=1 Tax=unclassified Pseudomonas TaxID=196821 RepID=UPI002B2364DD|nr:MULTISPECIES: sensor domain-containing diguanylate cyclase [unclassified Pseudomonas]MEA9977294.1 sensor domain-containing diguanylate cyclase [Pseudomonas sp. RTS4]MEA9994004.1 sensor domain-containing diguanylate cyclase [Pseudomonas sp. AA4]MEB0088661.1 sensor domain-containing diguanylate cyclase [Pseudomonas sp. RTI1]MEB0124378.1 sensor domain-containing diguanylate cyclase [Pseudomonas sp. CCC1.2]MEB0151856.1 sensor domain-containing diguanylate cyclase [Pseudomonas sp. CCC4.3]
MPPQHLFSINLRRLIITLALLSAALTLVNSLYASYRVQRQLLIDNTLEANRTYATKLANSTDVFLIAARQQLAYSAALLSDQLENKQLVQSEVRRLQLQTNSFNSVVIVNEQGWIVALSPDLFAGKQKMTKTPGAAEALAKQLPLISQPYISVAGNLLVFISHPIVDQTGHYFGYIGGTLYLKKKSILNDLLGEQYYHDGSYLYVVDQNRRLLYHPDPSRVGQIVHGNPVVEAVIRGENGKKRLINSQGISMLAGYANVPSAHWGIVAQKQTQATLAALNNLMLDVLRNTLPLGILGFIIVWWLARLISRPLLQLAESAQEMQMPGAAGRIERVKPWYYEAAQLKRVMLVGVRLLHAKIGLLTSEAQTDSLTGLYNRRVLESSLERLETEKTPFAAVAVDIDHFKRVNDNFGHGVGDQVLKRLGELMRVNTRDNDVLCRVGGEEFLILLPNSSPEVALRVSERLRQHVESSMFVSAGHITISLGIAHWPHSSSNVNEVLKLADIMLYTAKQSGRNQVVSAPANPSNRNLVS